MRKNAINYTAAADKQITIKNIYDVQNVKESELALRALASDDTVWNTGANAVAGAAAVVADDTAFIAQHIASIRLYNSNSYVYLHPGDSLTITAKSANEALYYATMKSDFIEVESDVIAEGEELTDFDEDGIIDLEDNDIDNDGIVNETDEDDKTPPANAEGEGTEDEGTEDEGTGA